MNKIIVLPDPAKEQQLCQYCSGPNFFSNPLRAEINRIPSESILSDRIELLKKLTERTADLEDRLKAAEDDLVRLDVGISRFAADVVDAPMLVDKKNHPPGFGIPKPRK